MANLKPLTDDQKKEIKSYLKDFISNKLESFREKEDMNKPFYFALFSEESVITSSFLQSLYTTLGGEWEKIARLVAKNKFNSAKKGVVEGKITDAARSEIDNILDELDAKTKKPDISKEVERVRNKNKIGTKKSAKQQVDLILKEKDKSFIFIEIKSVKPNKNEVKAAKRDLLKLSAMNENSKIFLGMPYNPYFSRDYRRWTVLKFFKEDEDLLIGKNFWDFLGGRGTYEKLLDIFGKVGLDIKDNIKEFIKNLKKDKQLRLK